jgi:hypothetical protein
VNEQEIKSHVAALLGAAVKNDDKMALASAAALLGSLLVDLNRVANALAKLAADRIKEV